MFPKLSSIRKNENYCDVNIRIKEFVFSCHPVILASASEFFDSMSQANIEKSFRTEISLEDIDFQTFELILHFIYSGTIVITEETVMKLFTASEYLGIPSIEKACHHYLTDHMTVKNVVNVLKCCL